MKIFDLGSFCRLAVSCFASLVCVLYAGRPSQAAYLSEIELGGPAGQAIELSQVDPATDHTVLFISASPTSSFLFGMVLDVLYLPAGLGRGGVAMVSDSVWADDPALTTPLSSLSLASGDSALPLVDNVLLVVMQGQSDVTRFMNPLSDAAADTAYDETAVTDWLVLNKGDQSQAYAAKDNLDEINAELGIDLLTRLIDKDAGRVMGRANEPGQSIDMDTFYAGDPNPTSQQFDVDGHWFYTYTPGMNNLPLTAHMPEPGTLAMLVILLGLMRRQPRESVVV